MVNEKELTRQIQELFPTITIEDEYRQMLLASVFFKESVMELHFEIIGGMVTSTDLHKIAEHIKEATGLVHNNLWRVASIPQTDKPKLMAVLMQFTEDA